LVPLSAGCSPASTPASRPSDRDRSVDAGESRPIASADDGGIPDASGIDATGPLAPPNLVESINLFGRDLHRQLATGRPANVLSSPLSVSIALSMVWVGSRGATADELRKALYFTAGAERAYAKLLRHLSAEPSDEAPVVRIANAVWVEKTAKLLPAYTSSMQANYDAPARLVDFRSDASGARAAINQWVRERTKGKIPELLPEDGVDAATRVMLTNAIYLKANWLTPFRKELTRPEVFHVDGTTPRKVPTMHAEMSARYGATTNARVLELPYVKGKGTELSMVIVLPENRGGLKAVEKELGSTGLGPFVEKLQANPKVEISLPRFTAGSRFDLRPHLQSLGMRSMFGKADFSGMIVDEGVAVSAVFHEAIVATTETGTEAAGATAVGLSTVSDVQAEKVVFRADHPFLFFIRDVSSGVVIFAGRIISPSG
jgi:serpin B